jgi:hypothetical protein
MPPLKLFWYDGMTGPAFRPEGVPATEALIGGAGSLGERGQMFSGTGPIPGSIPGGRGPGGPGGQVAEALLRAAAPRTTVRCSSDPRASCQPMPTGPLSGCFRSAPQRLRLAADLLEPLPRAPSRSDPRLQGRRSGVFELQRFRTVRGVDCHGSDFVARRRQTGLGQRAHAVHQ